MTLEAERNIFGTLCIRDAGRNSAAHSLMACILSVYMTMGTVSLQALMPEANFDQPVNISHYFSEYMFYVC